MQIEAVTKLSQRDHSLRKKIELWGNLMFNLSMYLVLITTTVIYAAAPEELDYVFLTRIFKAVIEFIIALGLFGVEYC